MKDACIGSFPLASPSDVGMCVAEVVGWQPLETAPVGFSALNLCA